ncbi:MAG: hypothetical protein OEU68_04125 [Nitrospira sp.]|nr:hypothetical protein [Nitrospira sp.]MDH4242691.1 hypothetical protein [Nitrospira sp.]MDH4355040.1 hypothetical protein [Nitrospira sp.]MDH5316974.1 hypothetical protein [Nitrospira sp.]
MKQTSSQTVKLLNEERALLMSLAAKRDASYSDILRLGLYQLAKLDGLEALLLQAVQARLEHVCEVEAVWQGVRVNEPAAAHHLTDGSRQTAVQTGGS